MTQNRKVVITGCGIGSPAGYSIEENVRAWQEGITNFSEITAFNPKDSGVKFAGQCPKPDVRALPDRKVQKILRRKDVISLLTTLKAAANAKLQPGDIEPERIGMYVGTGSTQVSDLASYFELVEECADVGQDVFDAARFGEGLMTKVNPLVVLQSLMNNGLCYGTMALDIRGVNANFMDFQVAGLRALGEAYRSIATGRADCVIAGGISGPIEPFQLAEGVRAGYLASTADLPEPTDDLIRPYDRERRGAVLSEGSAYLVLEEEGVAIRRGAPVLGRVEGFSLTNDGTFDMMNGEVSPGLPRAIEGAMSEARMKREDLGLVVGHGNGSLYPDRAEARSYVDFFGEGASSLPVTSPKSVLGDMCEAGGVVSAILALETFRTGVVPPTFNFKGGDEWSTHLGIRGEAQECRMRRAVITSRNLFGLCSSLVLAEA